MSVLGIIKIIYLQMIHDTWLRTYWCWISWGISSWSSEWQHWLIFLRIVMIPHLFTSTSVSDIWLELCSIQPDEFPRPRPRPRPLPLPPPLPCPSGFLLEGFLSLLPGGLPRPLFDGWSWTEGGAGQLIWSANAKIRFSEINENYEIRKQKSKHYTPT